MSFALIQGSSKGIGLALARYLLLTTKLNVIATTSSGASEAREAILSPVSKHHQYYHAQDRLTTLHMDVTNESVVEACSRRVSEMFGNNLRLLVNVSGILHAERSLSDVKAEDVIRTFQINTIGHLLVYKHFVPLIARRHAGKQDEEGDLSAGLLSPGQSVLVSVTARVGSISDNRTGGWYSYRSSKSATNQIIRTLSHELQFRKYPAIAFAYHPGTVKTALSNPYVGSKEPDPAKGLLSAEDAAERFTNVLKKGVSNGAFVDWKGEAILW